MRGAIHPLFQYASMAWCLVKHRDFNFTFYHFSRVPWKVERPIARPLPTRDSTIQKNADVHPSFERDSNPRFQCSIGPIRNSLSAYYVHTLIKDWISDLGISANRN